MTYLLCLHRWVGGQARYADYPVPAGLDLRFVATRESRHDVEPLGASVDVVDSLDDTGAARACIAAVVERHGPPARVVALNEGDLLTAAWTRETYGVPGEVRADTARFRDKLEMAEVAARQGGVRVLASAAADRPDDVAALVAAVGFPVVVKPRLGTASRGVVLAADDRELAGALAEAREPSLVQQHCDDPIHHVDGWWDGSRVAVATASAYLNSCAEFGAHSALGSVELPGGGDEERLLAAAGHVLGAFAPGREIVFHLELFDGGDHVTFLELGARVGGAEIPFLWRDLRGVDLLAIAWEIQSDAGTQRRDAVRRARRDGVLPGAERGGWVLGRDARPAERPPSAYWTGDDEPRRAASGVYEGAPFRARLRNRCTEELLRDSWSLVSSASGRGSTQVSQVTQVTTTGEPHDSDR